MANERSEFCDIFACNCKLVVFSFFSFLFLSTFLCFFPRLYLSHRGSVFWLIIGAFAILFQISLFAFLFILIIKDKKKRSELDSIRKVLLIRVMIALAFILLVLTITTIVVARKLDADKATTMMQIQFCLISLGIFLAIESVDKKGYHTILFILFSGFIGTLILMAMLKLVDLLRLSGTDVTRVFVSALTWTSSYYLSLVMGKGYERIKNRGVITNEYKNQESN